MECKNVLPLLGLALFASSLSADITFAPPFQNGAVIQRDKPAPVWGRATPGKEVRVAFAGQTKKATARPDGRWQVTLDPLSASAEGRVLSATEDGLPAKQISDVLVGEVWLCSGQSNMEWIAPKRGLHRRRHATSG